MTMEALEVAEIAFEADGTEYRLAPPSPRIAFRVNREFGGLGKALDRCNAGDLDAAVILLRIACPDAPKNTAELEAFVFAHFEVMAWAVSGYCWSLQRGGKRPPGAPGAAPEPVPEPAEETDAGNAAPAAADER